MQTYNYLANELPRELIEIYNDIQSDILRIVVKNLKRNTDPLRVYQQIRDKIDEYKPNIEKIIAIIFEDSENKTIKSNKKAFKREALDNNEPLTKGEANAVISPIFLGALALLESINNKMVSSATSKYTENYNFLNRQNTKFTSGLDKLKQVYKNLIKDGISIYESFGGGQTKSYSIENVLRRDIMSLVNKANAEVNMANFKNSSAKFIEVSSHPTARTWNKYMKQPYEDHSSWQGKVYYSRDGEYVEGYLEFETTCGYGEGGGICGWNCYHQFQLNYTGESTATQYDQKEVEQNYALSQQQRAYERAIRQLKQARAVYEEAGDEKLARNIGQNITNATRQLKDFCEKNDLKYYNWRTQI